MNAELTLLLAFDQDDPAFARGFELGRVWATLSASEEAHEFTVHAANAEMVLRIAERQRREIRSEELGDEWMAVYFGPAE